MSVSDAYVRVTCDKCGTDEEVELTALAHKNAYDMRNVKQHLEGYGWRVSDDLNEAVCDSCVEAEEDQRA